MSASRIRSETFFGSARTADSASLRASWAHPPACTGMSGARQRSPDSAPSPAPSRHRRSHLWYTPPGLCRAAHGQRALDFPVPARVRPRQSPVPSPAVPRTRRSVPDRHARRDWSRPGRARPGTSAWLAAGRPGVPRPPPSATAPGRNSGPSAGHCATRVAPSGNPAPPGGPAPFRGSGPCGRRRRCNRRTPAPRPARRQRTSGARGQGESFLKCKMWIHAWHWQEPRAASGVRRYQRCMTLM